MNINFQFPVSGVENNAAPKRDAYTIPTIKKESTMTITLPLLSDGVHSATIVIETGSSNPVENPTRNLPIIINTNARSQIRLRNVALNKKVAHTKVGLLPI